MTCDGAPTDRLQIIDRGVVVCENGRIVYVGEATPAEFQHLPTRDLGGRLISPGLIDCHSHAIFAGDRAAEFGMRAAGATYLEIAAAGGGITASTAPTRAANDATLQRNLEGNLDRALRTGTTTSEVKSGYDLTCAGELRLLRCISRVAAARQQRLVPTLLCHLIPIERRADRDAYVSELCTVLIPNAAAAELATSVDVYCDEGAFTLDETRRIFQAARDTRLAVRGHVGQFADLGAAQLVAEFGGLSIDHVEQISAAGIAAAAAAKLVAVMLPGACVQLRLPVPPVAALRQAGVALAIASDLNPGSSYSTSLPLQMWLATTHFGMTVEEAWLGVTRVAAQALDLVDVGRIIAGARADLVVWNAEQPAAIPYRYGDDLVDDVFIAGTSVRT